MQKARRRLSTPTACKRTVSGSISLPCSGCFPPFPHGTGPLSVFRLYLALRHGRRRFRQDSTCPALLRCQSRTYPVTRTGLSPSADRLSRRFQFLACSLEVILQPRSRRNVNGLGSSHFDRHYFGNRYFFLFLQVLRCFSSLRLLRLKAGDGPSTRRVPPFGYLRINSCLQIPGAFRSLPRPSSLPEAKASPVRSSSLSRT